MEYLFVWGNAVSIVFGYIAAIVGSFGCAHDRSNAGCIMDVIIYINVYI